MIIASRKDNIAVTVTSFKVVSDMSNAARKDIEALQRRIGTTHFMSYADMEYRMDEEIKDYLEGSDNAYIHYLSVNGEHFCSIYSKKDYGKELFDGICNAIAQDLKIWYIPE